LKNYIYSQRAGPPSLAGASAGHGVARGAVLALALLGALVAVEARGTLFSADGAVPPGHASAVAVQRVALGPVQARARVLASRAPLSVLASCNDKENTIRS
jgi:hypothetical protein